MNSHLFSLFSVTLVSMSFAGCDFLGAIPPSHEDGKVIGRCLGDFQRRSLESQGFTVWDENSPDAPESFDLVVRIVQELKETAFQDYPNPIHVHLINSSSVNAFTTGGGYLYIYEGVIRTALDESWLAGIIAHEIGHMVHEHVLENLKDNPLTALLISNPYSFCETVDDLDPSPPGEPVRLTPAEAAESQAKELEADSEGTVILFDSVYEPTGLQKWFQNLAPRVDERLSELAISCPDNQEVWDPVYFSHPTPKTRAQKLNEYFLAAEGYGLLLSEFLGGVSALVWNSEDYDEFLQELDPQTYPDRYFRPESTGPKRDECGNIIATDSTQKSRKQGDDFSHEWEKFPAPLPF